MNQAADKLKSVIAPFVESSKTIAINISDQVIIWVEMMIKCPSAWPFYIDGHEHVNSISITIITKILVTSHDYDLAGPPSTLENRLILPA